MAKSKIDQYANIAAVYVTEAVAGTQASAKFAFPFSIMDKMGLLVNRIEYWIGNLTQMNSSSDAIYCGLCAASSVVDLTNQADPAIIDTARIQRIDLGAAASGFFVMQPHTRDFASLPGQGILVAPNPLYAIIQGVGCGAVVSMWMRVFYTYMEMSTDEYWQLVESRRIISS